jgi:ubiquinone/menaquinone biosynthesis C-methylase UbiE
MLAKIFLTLTDYPAFRRIVWKPIYEMLAKSFKIKGWEFMNYGYAPSINEAPLTLHQQDEINRFPIGLYHYLASKIDVEGMEMLEVGSGRGGGAAYIKKYLAPKRMVGLDIAYNAVKWASQEHAVDGLQYIQGTAEKLPFTNNSFDAVINVESCHAYGSVARFLREVKRVLRPGGYFLCTDMRDQNGIQVLKEKLYSTGMKMLSEEDITSNVVRAIELEENIKQKRIEEGIPRWLQRPFKEFAGVRGSKIHEDLKSGGLIYYRFVLQK